LAGPVTEWAVAPRVGWGDYVIWTVRSVRTYNDLFRNIG